MDVCAAAVLVVWESLRPLRRAVERPVSLLSSVGELRKRYFFYSVALVGGGHVAAWRGGWECGAAVG